MEVYRLAKKKYATTLSGKGAAISGGRWNSVGVEMIYTAENRSLAMAEVSVHFSLATIPDDYMMLTISIPDELSILQVDTSTLSVDWNTFPHKQATKLIGDDFVLKGEYCLLKVPSAVTQGDCNILINPSHPEFKGITIVDVVPFPFDKRVFGG